MNTSQSNTEPDQNLEISLEEILLSANLTSNEVDVDRLATAARAIAW
jgi:hypothetical protein